MERSEDDHQGSRVSESAAARISSRLAC